jgi:hypothetical protein
LLEGKIVDGCIEGVSDGRLDGESDLTVFEGRWEGLEVWSKMLLSWGASVLGLDEGPTEGINEGISEGRSEGIFEGVSDGAREGIAEGWPEGKLELSFEGVEDGLVLCLNI